MGKQINHDKFNEKVMCLLCIVSAKVKINARSISKRLTSGVNRYINVHVRINIELCIFHFYITLNKLTRLVLV